MCQGKKVSNERTVLYHICFKAYSIAISKNICNFVDGLSRCGSDAQRSTTQRQAGVYRHIIEKRISALYSWLTQKCGSFEYDVKNEVTIGATGVYIPIRAHFKHISLEWVWGIYI